MKSVDSQRRAEFLEKMIYAAFNYFMGFGHKETQMYVDLYREEHGDKELINHLEIICRNFITRLFKEYTD